MYYQYQVVQSRLSTGIRLIGLNMDVGWVTLIYWPLTNQ